MTGFIVGWEVRPLHEAEPTTAASILTRSGLPRGCLLLADSGHDSNPLHAAVVAQGGQLIAPRKKPGTGLGNRSITPCGSRACG